MLIGSVIGSTDAASVFAILRSRKLSLKNGLASLLEVESGSNDPFAYMLTLGVLTFMSNNGQTSLVVVLTKQIVVGLVMGFILAQITILIVKRVDFEIKGLYSILVLGIALLSYAVSEKLGGNGYLCTYIVGIMLGNSKISYKRSLIHFFDGISWLMQILLFFMLGLLSYPSQMPSITGIGLGVSLFLIFIARPIATFSILSWFKVPLKEQLFVAWVGLRGAASIVFAIYAVTYDVMIKYDLFHIVFFVALFSVAVQGTLLPVIAKKLDLVVADTSIFKTFNDYQEEIGTKLIEKKVDSDSPWLNKSLMEANIPEELLVVMIKRGSSVIVPRGSTVICKNDVLVLTGDDFESIAM